LFVFRKKSDKPIARSLVFFYGTARDKVLADFGVIAMSSILTPDQEGFSVVKINGALKGDIHVRAVLHQPLHGRKSVALYRMAE
jgi:hypothetical protein